MKNSAGNRLRSSALSNLRVAIPLVLLSGSFLALFATATARSGEQKPPTAAARTVSVMQPSDNVQEAWVARYNGPGNGDDVATGIAVDAAGNVYVTGYSPGSGTNRDYATIKYNTSGAQQWIARYNGPGNSLDTATAIALDNSGNVYVTGSSFGGTATGYDYATIKYNSAGQQQWVARYNGPANGLDSATAIAVDSSGNVYVTGKSPGSGTGADYATIKYNSAGQQQWVARYNGPGNGDDVATGLVLDYSGNVYVTGRIYGYYGAHYNYGTIKYNSSGQQQWLSSYYDPNSDRFATAIVFNNDYNGEQYVFVAGYGQDAFGNAVYTFVRYNASTGQEDVNHEVNDFGDYRPAAAVVCGLGNECVTGRASSASFPPPLPCGTLNGYGYNYLTDFGEHTGDGACYNGPGNGDDVATGIAVDNSGYVYVTGSSVGSGTGTDYATIKYGGSFHDELWVARYNGPGNGGDVANAIAIDSSGNVYVTGSSVVSGTSSDYATIKYVQTTPTPTPTPTPTITSAVSRKTHGGAGIFDINLPLTGTNGVECRTTGGTNDYTMVVTFSGNVTVTGSPQAQLTMGTGCVGSAGACTGNVTVSGNTVTVPLTNIANAQNISVRINGVNSAGSDVPATDFNIPMGVLWGDTNANRTVNAADVSQTNSRLGQTVDGTNFRSDVNANGSINAADTAIIKQNSGTSLPP